MARRALTLDVALGSWADEMDAQPLPSVPAPFGARGDRDRGERREYTQPAWETARTGSGVGGGMDRGMGMNKIVKTENWGCCCGGEELECEVAKATEET